eukprot:scaffold251858_cov39-Prasinocladus_malaysianus.AAC.1
MDGWTMNEWIYIAPLINIASSGTQSVSASETRSVSTILVFFVYALLYGHSSIMLYAVLEGWYPTAEIGDKKGIVLLVTTSKDGAVTGGPGFMNAIGDDLIDSIIADNIPILTEEELYNEAMVSTLKRIDAKLNGEEVPPPPSRKDTS